VGPGEEISSRRGRGKSGGGDSWYCCLCSCCAMLALGWGYVIGGLGMLPGERQLRHTVQQASGLWVIYYAHSSVRTAGSGKCGGSEEQGILPGLN
jgi:hypothetical protein